MRVADDTFQSNSECEWVKSNRKNISLQLIQANNEQSEWVCKFQLCACKNLLGGKVKHTCLLIEIWVSLWLAVTECGQLENKGNYCKTGNVCV